MSWHLFVVISILSISFANIFQKKSMMSEGADPLTASVIFQLMLGFFTGIFALIVGFSLPEFQLFIRHFPVSMVLYGLGTLAFFKAVQETEASVVTLASGFGAIVTIASAAVFLGERLTTLQMIGALLILFAVTIVSFRRNMSLDKGILFALAGTSLYGLAITNDTLIIRQYEAISYTPIMSFMPVLLFLLLFPKRILANIKNARVDWINLSSYSLLYSVQAVTYYLALEYGALASQMNSIFKVEIIFTVFLTAYLLNERSYILKKTIAAVIAIIGAVLVR